MSDQYASWFPRPVGKRTGEWTPGYLYYYWVADLLHRLAPQARILVLLRDPIERYLSGLVHQRRRGGKASPSEAQRAYDRGFYGRQLAPWEALFPANRLLVLQYEQCVAEPAMELARTYRFLGVDDAFVPDGLSAGHVLSRKPGLSDRMRDLLQAAYEPDVHDLVRRHPSLDLSLWPNFVPQPQHPR